MLHLQIKLCKIMGQRNERDREKRRSMPGRCKEPVLTFNWLKPRPRWAAHTRIGLRGSNLQGCVPSASHSQKPGQKAGKIGISKDCVTKSPRRYSSCADSHEFPKITGKSLGENSHHIIRVTETFMYKYFDPVYRKYLVSFNISLEGGMGR